jgi:hypothetical protein
MSLHSETHALSPGLQFSPARQARTVRVAARSTPYPIRRSEVGQAADCVGEVIQGEWLLVDCHGAQPAPSSVRHVTPRRPRPPALWAEIPPPAQFDGTWHRNRAGAPRASPRAGVGFTTLQVARQPEESPPRGGLSSGQAAKGVSAVGPATARSRFGAPYRVERPRSTRRVAGRSERFPTASPGSHWSPRRGGHGGAALVCLLVEILSSDGWRAWRASVAPVTQGGVRMGRGRGGTLTPTSQGRRRYGPVPS